MAASVRWAIWLMAPALMALGCTAAAPAGPMDAGPEVLDSTAHDAPTEPWPAVGALWSCLWIELPCTIETINLIDPCQYASPDVPPLLLRAYHEENGLFMRGGTGQPFPGDSGAYAFADQLVPSIVGAVTGATTMTDGGVRTPFETTTPFSWPLALIPQQPPFEVVNAAITGTLDPDAVPTSDLPPMAGTLTGCLGEATTQAIYLPTLVATLHQLLVDCGAPLGCDATGGGSLDGYVLQAHWSGQSVAIDEPAAR